MATPHETLISSLVRRHSHDGLTDAGLHFVLEQAALASSEPTQVDCPLLEVGSYKGNTARAILDLLDALSRSAVRPPPALFTVDPYGGKPYLGGNRVTKSLAYGDPIYLAQKANLVSYANHAHWLMTGVEFLSRVAGTVFWRNGRMERMGDFAFCFLDGDHDATTVIEELQLTLRVMAARGRIVVDNVDADALTKQALRAICADKSVGLSFVDRERGAAQALIVVK